MSGRYTVAPLPNMSLSMKRFYEKVVEFRKWVEERVKWVSRSKKNEQIKKLFSMLLKCQSLMEKSISGVELAIVYIWTTFKRDHCVYDINNYVKMFKVDDRSHAKREWTRCNELFLSWKNTLS